ncbi:hypothetical protein WDV94_10210 [Clavibacter tessellarius]
MRRSILMWAVSAAVVTAAVLAVTTSEHQAPGGPLASALFVSSAGPLTFTIRRRREIATRSDAADGVERAVAARAAAAVFRDLLVILPAAVLVLVASPATSPVLLVVAVLVAALVDEGSGARPAAVRRSAGRSGVPARGAPGAPPPRRGRAGRASRREHAHDPGDRGRMAPSARRPGGGARAGGGCAGRAALPAARLTRVTAAGYPGAEATEGPDIHVDAGPSVVRGAGSRSARPSGARAPAG